MLNFIISEVVIALATMPYRYWWKIERNFFKVINLDFVERFEIDKDFKKFFKLEDKIRTHWSVFFVAGSLLFWFSPLSFFLIISILTFISAGLAIAKFFLNKGAHDGESTINSDDYEVFLALVLTVLFILTIARLHSINLDKYEINQILSSNEGYYLIPQHVKIINNCKTDDVKASKFQIKSYSDEHIYEIITSQMCGSPFEIFLRSKTGKKIEYKKENIIKLERPLLLYFEGGALYK